MRATPEPGLVAPRWEWGRGHWCFRSGPRIVGILNVTPDSFSDGGRWATSEAALARAEVLLDEGADGLDLGGQSTRPGAALVGANEECRRVLPVLRALRARTDAVLSVDTFHADVARAALDAGADVINDVSGGLLDPGMLPLLASWTAGMVCMHAPIEAGGLHGDQGDVADPAGHVLARWQQGMVRMEDAGIAAARVALDPGFGFGWTLAQNWALARELPRLLGCGRPVFVGVSRKRMVRQVCGEGDDRVRAGTVALHTLLLASGAHIVRVHEVGDAVAARNAVARIQQVR